MARAQWLAQETPRWTDRQAGDGFGNRHATIAARRCRLVVATLLAFQGRGMTSLLAADYASTMNRQTACYQRALAKTKCSDQRRLHSCIQNWVGGGGTTVTMLHHPSVICRAKRTATCGLVRLQKVKLLHKKRLHSQKGTSEQDMQAKLANKSTVHLSTTYPSSSSSVASQELCPGVGLQVCGIFCHQF